MNIIGKDCEDIINDYVNDLNHEEHRKKMKGTHGLIRKMLEIHTHRFTTSFDFDDKLIETKIFKKLFMSMILTFNIYTCSEGCVHNRSIFDSFNLIHTEGNYIIAVPMGNPNRTFLHDYTDSDSDIDSDISDWSEFDSEWSYDTDDTNGEDSDYAEEMRLQEVREEREELHDLEYFHEIDY